LGIDTSTKREVSPIDIALETENRLYVTAIDARGSLKNMITGTSQVCGPPLFFQYCGFLHTCRLIALLIIAGGKQEFSRYPKDKLVNTLFSAYTLWSTSIANKMDTLNGWSNLVSKKWSRKYLV
jgi:hypothetical protein